MNKSMRALVKKSESFDDVSRKFAEIAERLGSLESAPLAKVIVAWTQSTHECTLAYSDIAQG